ncbi:MAG TPA: sigma-70 family RNA polymerase sigma factor [Acholeplasmataceae bacterium]|nr:sigma-70 family RNA polymerase sigma factor [Acholeplasmataceae bacterium]
MDKSVIKQLVNDSELAFELIFNKYYALIKQICYFYCKNNDEAEDLAIQTFTKLWNNRKNINIDKNLKYYITKIAQNLCIDYLRKKKREKTTLMDISDLERLSPKYVQDHDKYEDLQLEIKELLDQESYEILVLHYVHNLKYREIAAMKKVSTSVITNKASRAMKILREKLKK